MLKTRTRRPLDEEVDDAHSSSAIRAILGRRNRNALYQRISVSFEIIGELLRRVLHRVHTIGLMVAKRITMMRRR
jgi:hypothetical protein